MGVHISPHRPIETQRKKLLHGAILDFDLRSPIGVWKSQIVDLFSTEESISQVNVTDFKELKTDINQLKNEISENNRLLSVSNDLMLELIATFKLQESQAYFWTDDWLNAEKSADNDIKNNNIVSFKSSSQIIEFLHRDD